MYRVILTSALLLAGCSDWPDAGAPSPTAAPGSWPVLLPLDQVLANGDIPEAEDKDAVNLSRRAAALRARAAVMRSNPSDMDALRARLAR